MVITVRPAWVVLGLTLLAGCQNMNHTGSGALVGTGLGAVAGAAIGDGSGHAAGGALIGATAGALAGGLIGNAEDAREERDAAIAQAQYADARSRSLAQALTASDVVSMSHNGVGDDVIINSLRTRGCRFDSTPDNIIRLKQQGVSDRVLGAMQDTGLRPAAGAPVPPPAYYVPPPAPGPSAVVVIGPRRSWGPPPYRPYWGRPHPHWHYRW